MSISKNCIVDILKYTSKYTKNNRTIDFDTICESIPEYSKEEIVAALEYLESNRFIDSDGVIYGDGHLTDIEVLGITAKGKALLY